jgi:ubiquinone/menaquinone biosynthesis C-methylase UbiE
MADKYLDFLQKNQKKTEEYYKKSVTKTEQQKYLEEILLKTKDIKPKMIADIACGGGTLTYHIRHMYPDANYSLLDYNSIAIETAKELNGTDPKIEYKIDDLYKLPYNDNTFDLVFCWMTLSWIENPKKALNELIRIAKPKAKIYLSSLFNIDHDVDIYSKVFDYSRETPECFYNTYSKHTVNNWISKKVTNFEIVEFNPDIDIIYNGKGIGTNTKLCEGKKIQISAGMLLNWGILTITK